MTLFKPVREENSYVQFGYGSHKICNLTWVQLSGSIKYYAINTNVYTLQSPLGGHNWSMNDDKYSGPTRALATTFLNSAGQENMYVHFGYSP